MEEDEDTISELMYTLDGINMLILRRDLRQKNSASFANNMALRCEMNSLRDESKKMTDELEVSITKMKQENQALKALYVNHNGEMASVLSESEKKTGQITKLINAQQALQQQLEEKYRVSLDKQSQEIHEKSMIIEDLVFCNDEHIITIQELRTSNKRLEVQLEKARMFGGPHMDQLMSKKVDPGWLPHSHVEVEKDQAPELDGIEEKKGPVIDGQTKSWWRRQVKKLVKGVGTFRLCLKGCLGVKRFKKPVARLIQVQPVNSTSTTMDIGMPPVSV